ncbi:ClpXP protease specificity-enhancing factor [Variovorax dokdonensis]|uniref:ClpXP protease specificity-enhancing factor n=1 Tax=Variovorax dokdonensis TaxID=344883 RepID=A0ABT7NBW7_9BURK|nr:ClpXP protease specificity-enhancing factor [Variovorax dokdonensis]MDM0045439.1 ClpXP protease specificity-enhancing factor [Variovorax dokdonensis]
MISAIESSSTRPYLIRALYEWCTDNGFTPYVAVQVDESVQVPREYVKNGEIVLNISFDATSALKLGNDYIEFKARFAGVARDIMVPVNRVIAIYARENGQGMAFPPVQPASVQDLPQPVPADKGAAPVAAKTKGASRGADSDPARVVHLVPADGADAEGSPTGAKPSRDDETPPKPPAGGGARPSLKRVK